MCLTANTSTPVITDEDIICYKFFIRKCGEIDSDGKKSKLIGYLPFGIIINGLSVIRTPPRWEKMKSEEDLLPMDSIMMYIWVIIPSYQYVMLVKL